MNAEAAAEIIQCLPKGRTLFHYFRDRYALELLGYFVGDGLRVADAKASPFARLLARPVVKDVLAGVGQGLLTREELTGFWPSEYVSYLLTLGTWEEDQTTRGDTNLVLQMNFSRKHDEPYTRLVKPSAREPFAYSFHPINKRGRHTLAWARLDVELERGEALIEEIQTDWVRMARRRAVTIKGWGESEEERERLRGLLERLGIEGTEVDVVKYASEVLAPHMRLWDEAMLFAAIWFLREELGLRRIFYHTYTYGAYVKRIYGAGPPRSLYTTLPKKFCFRETDTPPSFFAPRRRRRSRRKDCPPSPRFFLLEL